MGGVGGRRPRPAPPTPTATPTPAVTELAQLLKAGETTWDALDLDDVDVRLKWVGMFHRRKRTPGRFMMRVRVPNGELTAPQLRALGECIGPYGDDGCADITTRAGERGGGGRGRALWWWWGRCTGWVWMVAPCAGVVGVGGGAPTDRPLAHPLHTPPPHAFRHPTAGHHPE